MRRKHLIFYVSLALAAPMPAFALGLGSGSAPGASSLDAHASLDTCGLFSSQIVCKIDVGYNEVAGANRYTASVAAPNGSVSDYGTVAAGGTSLWVPYSGDGDYSVTIQAWGQAPAPGKHARLVTSDVVRAGGNHARRHHRRAANPSSPPAPGSTATSRDQARSAGAQDVQPQTQDDSPPPDCAPTDTSSEGGSSGDTGATG
ncbi:MAG TPA: hypothetical protein VEL05_10070, partial [Candidatus Acidoferrum sp.]|nr:hypothetical protein [Candidatus Acidoferrum sp.]